METYDIEQYVSAWKKRLELEGEREKVLAKKALDTAYYLTKVLVDKYGVKRAYLFGISYEKTTSS